MKSKKHILDLKYNNLLNWRSILFGFYFAILALIGSYLFRTHIGSITNLLFMFLFSGAICWIVFDELKYSEIKNELENIEKQIQKLK